MPKLSEINLDPNKFKGKGLRPWTETQVKHPYEKKAKKNNTISTAAFQENKKTNKMVSKQEAIGKQTVSNKKTEKNLNGNQLASKQEAIGKQTANKQEAIGKQTVNKQEAIGKQTVNKQKTEGKPNRKQLVNKQEAIGKQKNTRAEDNITTIYKLTGLQKILFFYMVEKCELRGDFETGAISSDLLVQLTKTTTKTIKSILKRLSDKGLLIIDRVKSKPGKGGFRYYSIKKEFKLAAMEFKRIEKIPSKIEEIKGKQLVGQSVISQTHNSNSNINTITTENKNKLPNEWESIDISSLQTIGFSSNNLKQLINLNHPAVVQESIHRFAYTLNHDFKAKEKFKDPLRVIMGVLRKGEGWSEPNYESPQDRSLRELLERKKAEKAKRDKMIQELVKLEFPDWEKTLTPEERQRIAPPAKALNTNWDNSPEKLLRDHFANVVLPKRLEEEGML